MINLRTSAGSSKKQESSRKTSTATSLTMPKPLCGSQSTVENSERDGNTRPPDLPLEKSACRERSNSWNKTWNDNLVPNQERSTSRPYILSPCLFNLYAEYIMQNAGLCDSQAEIKISGRNINNLRYADDTTLTAES